MMSILAIITLLLTFLSTCVNAIPTSFSSRATHACTVFVQRWYDDSFDITYYNYNWQGDNPANPRALYTAESTALTAGSYLPEYKLGSHVLSILDVANPAVVNGQKNWNDPGKLSFVWGTTKWGSFSAGNPCTVVPVGFGSNGEPTTTTCHFSCDA